MSPPDEISVKLTCPRICHVFLFGVFATDSAMNVMPEFVKQHMAEEDVSPKRSHP
jgi:hypothetical protein